MSEENVELLRGCFDAFARGDVDAMLEPFAEDVVFYRSEPEGVFFHGRDGFLRAVAEWTAGFQDFTATPAEFFDAGEWVVTRVSQTARWGGGSDPVVSEFWYASRIHEGRVVRFEIHVDREGAFAAAGMA